MTDVTLIPIIGAYCSQVYITENKEEFYLFFRMIGESQNKLLKFYHEQECCEQVFIEDVCGDIKDLMYSPITQAEVVSEQKDARLGDSQTWTFYKFATAKGSVTLRWLGESNGYYSERVDQKIYELIPT